MQEIDRLSDLETEVAALDTSLGQAAAMAAAFDGSLKGLSNSLDGTVRDLGDLQKGFSSGLRRAFDGVVFDGLRLGDALNMLARSMADTAYNAAMRPVTDHFGTMLADGVNALVSKMMPFANGGTFAQGRVMPFAHGGVLSGPVSFPMRGGSGLMGEAGPEAIMPLARGPDGRLGVKASGGSGRPVQVTMNITTPDLASFRRSQSQIAAEMARALGLASRNQ